MIVHRNDPLLHGDRIVCAFCQHTVDSAHSMSGYDMDVAICEECASVAVIEFAADRTERARREVVKP